jgi:hypothetical protein
MIEGTHEVVLTIRYTVPPGQNPIDAGKQIQNAGAMIPVGLLSFVKDVQVQVLERQDKPKLV